MKLLTYIQQNYGIARRTITEAIKEQRVFLDEKPVEWYATELKYGQHLYAKIMDKTIDDVITEVDQKTETVLFHKSVGYVCSKSDPHNKTIYRLLGEQYKNYYYIGRLDKDSRGLVMLTNDPKVVHQYEHPKHKINKEYIVTVKVRDQDFVKRLMEGTKDTRFQHDSQADFIALVQKLFIKGLLVDEDGKLAKKENRNADLLRVVSMEVVTQLDKQLRALKIMEPDTKGKIFVLRITLNEGKKRHIRRIWSSIWWEVLDLVRTKIGEHTIDKLDEEESRIV